MFCRNCGNKLNEGAAVCVSCGCLIENKIHKKNKNSQEKPNLEKVAVWFSFSAKILIIAILFCLFYSIFDISLWSYTYRSSTYYSAGFNDAACLTAVILSSFAFTTSFVSLICFCIKTNELKSLLSYICLSVASTLIMALSFVVLFKFV